MGQPAPAMTVSLIDGSTLDVAADAPIGLASYPEGEDVVEEHFAHWFVQAPDQRWLEISLATFNQLAAAGHKAQDI